MMDSVTNNITATQAAIAAISFLAGFVTKTFVLGAKERKDVHQTNFVNSKELATLQQDRFDDLMAVFGEFSGKRGQASMEDFAKLTTVANRYLYQQQITAAAIMGGKVDPVSRDTLLLKKLIDTVEVTLPAIDEALHEIAKENNITYPINFKREDYEGIFAVAEKFGGNLRREPKPLAANNPSTDATPERP